MDQELPILSLRGTKAHVAISKFRTIYGTFNRLTAFMQVNKTLTTSGVKLIVFFRIPGYYIISKKTGDSGD